MGSLRASGCQGSNPKSARGRSPSGFCEIVETNLRGEAESMLDGESRRSGALGREEEKRGCSRCMDVSSTSFIAPSNRSATPAASSARGTTSSSRRKRIDRAPPRFPRRKAARSGAGPLPSAGSPAARRSRHPPPVGARPGAAPRPVGGPDWLR